ncbi:hypothetical protein H0H92_015555 [Tricholoma furcatifolium]|nr:hypothetical protein H0H92_015555 [Tricholoma furcatifolium]
MKHSLSALPLPKSLLIHRLTADAQRGKPSLQRRARLLAPESHFSFVNPFPCPFPYDIEPSTDETVTDKAAYIEQWLADRDAVHERPSTSPSPLRIHDRKLSDQPRVLLGIAPSALRDCLPSLDVGDAFSLIGTPTLSDEFSDQDTPHPDPAAVSARNELIDILSGHSVLATPKSHPDPATAFAPWSLRYSGHQFGTWAGQLGDGRAISILATPHPSDPSQVVELQLKGAGRTPFSRTADGLAVVRSSIREYLCSEAMHALDIPTTRALSLVSLPALPVQRESQESACVLTRLAPSFIRIGSFEALNGPANMFFFGGGQQQPDLEALRVLAEYVAQDLLRMDVQAGKPYVWEMVKEVARRNAEMVAAWQAYGFMHGVMNTDK